MYILKKAHNGYISSAYMGKQGGTGPQNTNWSQRLLSTKKNVDRRKSRNTNSFSIYEFVYEFSQRIQSGRLPKYELVH